MGWGGGKPRSRCELLIFLAVLNGNARNHWESRLNEIKAMKGVMGESSKDFQRRKQEASDLHEQIISELYKQARITDEKRNEAYGNVRNKTWLCLY